MQTRQEYAEKSYDDIMNLLGADELKQIIGWLQNIKENKDKFPGESISLPSYLWVMRRGGGIKTCVTAFTEYLHANMIIEFTGLNKCFMHKLEYTDPLHEFRELTRLHYKTAEFAGYHRYFRGVICVDISDWSRNFTDPYFGIFLKYIESKKNHFLTIFYLDTEQNLTVENAESALSSQLRFDTVRYKFPSPTELVEYLEKKYLLPKNNSLTKAAKKVFVQTIDEIADKSTFDGFNTIREIVNDLLFFLYHRDLNKKSISDEILNTFIQQSDYVKRLKASTQKKKMMGFDTSSQEDK
jgi:hypothetical protein